MLNTTKNKKQKQILKPIFLFFFLSSIFILHSKAQIVYTDINPDTTIISGDAYEIKTYGLDLNNDGTVDFNIYTYRTAGGFYVYPHFFVKVTPLNTNEVLDSLSGGVYYPVALGLNRYVRANLLWRNISNQILRHEIYRGPHWGFWSLNADAYLGLKVIAGSDTGYGWARLSIQFNNPAISFTVKDYAYNSIPNQPILAGETSCVTPTITLSASGPLSFCAGDSVALTANGTGYQYQWKKGGVNITGAKSQTYVPKTGGTYKCKVTNSCGSKLSTGKTVTVPCRDASLPGMTSAELEQLSVFPNPANNSVTIKFLSDNDENAEPAEVQIINLFGEIILQRRIIAEQTQIDVSKFSAGMYVVRCNSREINETKTFSIMK